MLLNLADCCFIFLPCEINGGAILGHIRLGVNHFFSFFIDLWLPITFGAYWKPFRNNCAYPRMQQRDHVDLDATWAQITISVCVKTTWKSLLCHPADKTVSLYIVKSNALILGNLLANFKPLVNILLSDWGHIPAKEFWCGFVSWLIFRNRWIAAILHRECIWKSRWCWKRIKVDRRLQINFYLPILSFSVWFSIIYWNRSTLYDFTSKRERTSVFLVYLINWQLVRWEGKHT